MDVKYSRRAAIKAGTRCLRRAWIVCKPGANRDKWINEAKQVMKGHEDDYSKIYAKLEYLYLRG